jgi:hypothetical protein
LEDAGVDGRIILRWIVRKWDVETWTGSIWLKIGTGGGHLWMRLWAFGFHKIRGISWPAENQLASQEGLAAWSKQVSCCCGTAASLIINKFCYVLLETQYELFVLYIMATSYCYLIYSFGGPCVLMFRTSLRSAVLTLQGHTLNYLNIWNFLLSKRRIFIYSCVVFTVKTIKTQPFTSV